MNIESTPKYYEYDSSKKLSQQIRMSNSTYNQLKKVSPFESDYLDIMNIFDCCSIRTTKGIFSLTLYVTPRMKDNKAWLEHEIRFQAVQISDTSFDQSFLKTYSIEKADEIFNLHFVST